MFEGFLEKVSETLVGYNLGRINIISAKLPLKRNFNVCRRE